VRDPGKGVVAWSAPIETWQETKVDDRLHIGYSPDRCPARYKSAATTTRLDHQQSDRSADRHLAQYTHQAPGTDRSDK